MTLEQLRIFVAVGERQHVTRAAEALRLTQSAVSGALRSLEARHDILLFNRVGRRIELTQDGRNFLEQARAVLNTAGAAERSLRELRGSMPNSQTLRSSCRSATPIKSHQQSIRAFRKSDSSKARSVSAIWCPSRSTSTSSWS